MLATVLAGCGGGGGGGGSLTPPETPGVTLTVRADTVRTGTRSVAGRVPVITASVDDGADVVALNYSTGSVIASGKLVGGKSALRVTPGLTIVVVVTGKRDGKNYRLSTIIPTVPIADKDVVADPATTIAAEAIASKHAAGAGTVLDHATCAAVLAKAAEFVLATPAADYSVGGGLLGGTEFGKPGSIVVAEIPEVVAAVPVVINNSVVLAKNAIQQIKEAGVPLAAMASQEIPDAQRIFTDEVLGKYVAFVSGLRISILGSLLADDSAKPQLDGHSFYIEDDHMGRTFSGVYVAGGRGVLSLTDTGAGPADRYTITVRDGALTRTLVVVKSGTQLAYTETVSDGSAEYKASFPVLGHSEDLGANPSYTGTLSLKNAAFPTAVTFAGTLSAVGMDIDSYRKVVFDGTLTAPNFSMGGRFECNFPSSKPAGAKAWQSIYDFMTSASMTDGRVSITDGATTMTLTGDIRASFSVATIDGYSEAWPTHFELSGKYRNSHSGLGFDGDITANWTNPGDVTELTARGDVQMVGKLTRTGHPTYSQDVKVTLDGGVITSTIDLRVGSNTLIGSASGNMVRHKSPYGKLTLTNQAGVQFNLDLSSSYVLTGDIKAGAALATAATISEVGDRIRIAYTDGTFDEF